MNYKQKHFPFNENSYSTHFHLFIFNHLSSVFQKCEHLNKRNLKLFFYLYPHHSISPENFVLQNLLHLPCYFPNKENLKDIRFNFIGLLKVSSLIFPSYFLLFILAYS